MTEIIVAVAIAILLARQLKASIPRLIDRVLRYAVKKLPEDLRARYHEEWSSHLEDTLGYLGKLLGALDFIRASRAIRLDRQRRPWRASFSKNLLNRVVAAIILVAILPVFLMLAALIKLDSRGPVLFRQKRYGLNNEVIEVFKFRSMYIDRYQDHVVTEAPLHCPRVTPIGRILRRTSLDELPLFLNVLMGTMSIVGPRPRNRLAGNWKRAIKWLRRNRRKR